MKIGLLWHDDDTTRTLAEKVERAAEFYAGKYGQEPNTCYVNSAMLDGAETLANGVEMRAVVTVLPNYFWIGVNDD